jgi:colanic acid biosynthesis glycosyl transferase WcaI
VPSEAKRLVRILIVGINYSPEETGIAPYTAGLAEHLAGRGHCVVVVTGLPSYPQWRVYDGYRRMLWKREAVHGVDVRRRWHYVPRQQSAIRRGLYEGTFLLTGLSALALPRPDAVLGIVPSLSGGLLARLAASRFRVPYGLIFQDLMGEAAQQSGVPGGGRVARLVRAGERWAARGAAAIGVIAEGFRPYLESLGVDGGRIRRVRNWTHVDPPTVERTIVRERLGLPQEAIVCLHSGNMGYKQGLENVIECARLATERDGRLLFVLIGDGNRRSHLEGLAGQYKLPNVRFLPLQSRDFFPNALAAADLLLVNQRGTVGDMSLPGKLTAYFASGQPIVAAVARDSETAREVAASGAGVVVEPDDPEALLGAIDGLLGDPARCGRLGAAGKRWAQENLTDAAALTNYEAFIQALLPADSSDGLPRLRAAA